MTEQEQTIKEKTYLCMLTADELLSLDGSCRPEIQDKVDAVKQQRKYVIDCPEVYQEIIQVILEGAERTGELKYYRGGRLNYCPVCETSAGYATYKRNSRYHQKGEPNHSRPLSFSKHEVGNTQMCQQCFVAIKPYLLPYLTTIKAEVSQHLAGEPPRWKRYYHITCKKCGWSGHEGELGKLRTMMADGYYHGECPSCNEQSLPFKRDPFERRYGEFTLVEQPKEQG